MPTVNPRITVTLTPSVHAVLRRLSALTRNSQSAMVGDLLSQSLPVLERMCKILEAAEKVRGNTMADITTDMTAAQERLEKQMGLALETMDAGVAPLLAEAERIDRRGGRSGRAPARGQGPASPAPKGLLTPISNRGVTPPLTTVKSKQPESSIARRRRSSNGQV